MSALACSRTVGGLLAVAALIFSAPTARADDPALARKAQEVLKANCYRCHGQDGAVEGGMNYILDREKLVARKKVVPGDAAASPLFKRVAAGKMPPPSAKVRPSEADIAVLKQWIDGGAASEKPATPHTILTEADVNGAILADLEGMERRPRRFMRYFSVAHLYNQGLGNDELATYRVALSKLLNSLSWHPKITQPKPIDAAQTLYRIDLRDFMWDSTLWNRILAEYPYAAQPDSAVARAVAVNTATRFPVVRADWFIATASHPPLYPDLLQLPANSSELERQLRVDVNLDIQQERVSRAGFNGSGIAKNNRLLERHDAVHGAYWRSYDFNEVPQNLSDRDTLLPDRRNLFAYPLGPGFNDNTFQHAGGEIIFNLPNGLQGYMLVNAKNERIDKAPTAIVSDPKRPDKAVETGISCMSCHLPGIHVKADQIRAHVAKNPKTFPKATRELVNALYPPEEKMKKLMEDDGQRYLTALERTGVHLGTAEPVITMTLRYEADVDLPTAAAEAGVKPEEFLKALNQSETLASNLGALKVSGGTIQRQVFVQAFADVVRALRLGTPLQPGAVGQSLSDNTGEIDPLEGPTSTTNAVAFSSDGKFALFASADKSVRLWDVDAGRELKRFIGHSASVWSVSFSPDNTRALSGSADGTVRLWDVDTGRELKRFEGHEGLVTAVAFARDGKQAISGGYDHQVFVWDLEKGKELLQYPASFKYVNAIAVAPGGKHVAIAARNSIVLCEVDTGKEVGRMDGHTDSVTSLAFSSDGKRLLSTSDDKTARLWNVEKRKEWKAFNGHGGYVKCAALSADGKRLLTGAADQSIRLWDVDSAKEVRRFEQHADLLLAVAFAEEGAESQSVSRDSAVRIWKLPKTAEVPSSIEPAKNTLPPAAELIIPGEPSQLVLSTDGKWLFYLLPSRNALVRVRASSLKADAEMNLPQRPDQLRISRDGGLLYAVSQAKDGKRPDGKLVVIDPVKMELRKELPLPEEVHDFATSDDSGGKRITLKEPVRAAVVDADGGVLYALTDKMTLRRYSYPDFKLQHETSVGLLGSHAALDAANKRLYVMGSAPSRSSDGNSRWFLYVYDLKAMAELAAARAEK